MVFAERFDEYFDVTIPSETARGQEVQERIVALMEKYEFTKRDVFSTRLALEEGIINAIKHGNRMDAAKTVKIQWGISSELVKVVISDEGEGFVPEEVPDPTADENLERPCGRGIMLMRAFMDTLVYNEVGNVLTIEKKKSLEE